VEASARLRRVPRLGGLLVGALLSSDPWLAAVLTALSCSAAQSTQSLWWSAAIGVSGRHVGALFG